MSQRHRKSPAKPPARGVCPMLAFGALVLSAPAVAAQESRPGIAVMSFENGGSYGREAEDFDALRVGLQQIMLTELALNPELRVVERSNLQALMEEQDLGASDRVEPGTAARIGRIVGARYVVLGSFVDLFGDVRIDARVVDVETSEIVRARAANDARDQMYQIVVRLADEVTRELDLPPLPETVRDARRDREIPAEAVYLFSRGQMMQDLGETERAIDFFTQVTDSYPEMTEAREALAALSGGP